LKALIVPHAGTIYSGPVAASAYARLAPIRDAISRVVLLGPSHRVFLRGIAAPTVERFKTPLGDIVVDRPSIESLLELPQVELNDEAHRREHSLEVHLPFLQEVLSAFVLVPLVVGAAEPAEVEEVLERLWGGPETLIVLSTDLSHHHRYEDACAIDRQTCHLIEKLAYERLSDDEACGVFPLRGLLKLARTRGLSVHNVDLRNSGDTAGTRSEVVGYGSFVVC
jgi:hypothetical protein